ncbi:MAG: hypothetical protein VW270_21695, partial [Candidatus Poseidoniales archaeon]
MTVKVTKPAVNVREKLSELDSPILDRLSEAGDGLSLQGDLTVSQKVGIGKDPGYAPLEVSSGTGANPTETQAGETLALFRSNSSSTSDAHVAIISGTSGQSRLFFGDVNDENAGVIEYNNASDYMSFRTSGSGEDVRINSSGNVGIGTENPAAKINVVQDIATAIIAGDATDNGAYSAIGAASGTAYLTGGSATSETVNLVLRTANAGNENTALTLAGSDLSATFAGDVTVSESDLTLSSAGGAQTSIVFKETTGNRGRINMNGGDNSLTIQGVDNGDNFASAIQLDKGASSGVCDITIKQDATFEGEVTVSANDLILTTPTSGTYSTAILFKEDTGSLTDRGRIILKGSNNTVSIEGVDSGDNFANVIEIAKGSSSGVCDVTVNQNLAMAAGKGIDFSANANASGMTSELLNGYEEGTFTATLVPATSGTITLTSNNTMAYTKIGRQVFIQGHITVDSVSSPVG